MGLYLVLLSGKSLEFVERQWDGLTEANDLLID